MLLDRTCTCEGFDNDASVMQKKVIPVAMCSHVGNEICRNIVSIMDRTKTMAAVQKNVRILL